MSTLTADAMLNEFAHDPPPPPFRRHLNNHRMKVLRIHINFVNWQFVYNNSILRMHVPWFSERKINRAV